jgi:hypothetical protein
MLGLLERRDVRRDEIERRQWNGGPDERGRMRYAGKEKEKKDGSPAPV